MPFKKRIRRIGTIPKHCRVPSRTAGASANSYPRCPDPVRNPKKKSQKTQLQDRDEAISKKITRMGIALQFMSLDCPTRSEWYGRDGTIAYVRKMVHLPYSSNNIDIIRSVFEEVSHCVVNGLDYDGMSRKQDANKGGGKPVVDLEDKVLTTMIADLIENGFGLRNTLCLVNG
jgi:hypothetical protein